MKKTFFMALMLIAFACPSAAQKKATVQIEPPSKVEAGSPLSLDHLIGVFIFAKLLPNTFINGYIEFFPDHQWTMVVHFDDDRDRITDRHQVFRGSYEVRKQEGRPTFFISQEGHPDESLKELVFQDGRVKTFLVRGFSFTRHVKDTPLFDYSLNTPITAKELRIETDPAGAAVYLDGVRVEGNTPLIISNPPAGRDVNLRIEMVNFSPKTETVRLEQNESRTLSTKLVSGQAELWIATNPWTRVILDGAYKGDAPIKIKNLQAGIHTVRLENSGCGIEETFEVELPEGEVVKKKIDYLGALDIFVGRDAAIIDRKGKVIGKAPMQGLKLPVGNNTLRLEDVDKKMKIIQVRIKLDQVTTFNKDWAALTDWKE